MPHCVRWQGISSELEKVSFIKFKKCYFFFDIKDSIVNIQINSFGDACSRMYA